MTDYINSNSIYIKARHTHHEAEEKPVSDLANLQIGVTTFLSADRYFKPSFSVEIGSETFLSLTAHLDIDGLDKVIELFQKAKKEAGEYREERMKTLVKEKEALEGEIEKQAEALAAE